MDSLARDIIIGAVGSVLGAFFVFLGSQGWQLNKAVREKRQSLRRREEEQWRTRNMGIRQGITNVYLFEILKYLLFGNLFLALPTITTFLDFTSPSGFVAYRIILTIGGGLAFACFFVGLGRASRYIRLRGLD
jgi:hypothetical protein